MDFAFSPSELRVRDEIRAFLADALPPPGPIVEDGWIGGFAPEFSRRMGAAGWITHSPCVSAIALPIVWPLLSTVTAQPGSARPAMINSPVGSARTTSNVGRAALALSGACAFWGLVAGASAVGTSGRRHPFCRA